MPAVIKKLKNNDGTTIYPVTDSTAVYYNKTQTLADVIQNLKNNISDINSKIGSISIGQVQTISIHKSSSNNKPGGFEIREYFASRSSVAYEEKNYYRVFIDNAESLAQQYDNDAGSLYEFYIDGLRVTTGSTNMFGGAFSNLILNLNSGNYYLIYQSDTDSLSVSYPQDRAIFPRLIALENKVF